MISLIFRVSQWRVNAQSDFFNLLSLALFAMSMLCFRLLKFFCSLFLSSCLSLMRDIIILSLSVSARISWVETKLSWTLLNFYCYTFFMLAIIFNRLCSSLYKISSIVCLQVESSQTLFLSHRYGANFLSKDVSFASFSQLDALALYRLLAIFDLISSYLQCLSWLILLFKFWTLISSIISNSRLVDSAQL